MHMMLSYSKSECEQNIFLFTGKKNEFDLFICEEKREICYTLNKTRVKTGYQTIDVFENIKKHASVSV